MQYFNPRSPRGERLRYGLRLSGERDDFNPRSPRGERLSAEDWKNHDRGFQSTLPSRGATMAMQVAGLDDVNISIHAPLAGSDNGDAGRRIG